MLGMTIDPYMIDAATIDDPRAAYRALASAAKSYLMRMDASATGKAESQPIAMHTRIRGTGPGVCFGRLVELMESGLGLKWESPFEGSVHVSGAALPASEILQEERDDGFLFLRFNAGTDDLPLHVHPESDRFILVIGGRGFFHVSADSPGAVAIDSIRNVPARDRDAFMFQRGTVHTFSTAGHPLTLLSYHRPFVPLCDSAQYELTQPHLLPKEFLRGVRGNVSFDAAWTSCG